LPGLLLFFAIQISSFLSAGKLRKFAARVQQPFLQHVAIGLQAGLIGSFVALIFVSGQVQKLFWFQIFLTMCLPAVLKSARYSSARRLRASSPHASLEVPSVG